MAKKSMKETLFEAMRHGEERLNDIAVLRKVKKDPIVTKSVTAAAEQIHKKMLKLEVVEIIDTHKDAKIFRLASVDGYLPPFEAGQYINVFVTVDGTRTSRPYSISSSPRQRAYYEITVARTRNGFVSDYFLDHVKVGDVLEANGPAGVFRHQPVFHGKKSLFLAGGSGITPFMSMTREILDAGLDRDIVMLYGCRNEDVALYHDELSRMAKDHPNFKYYLVVSDDDVKDWKGEKGFLNIDLIRRLVPDFEERTSYICGPQVMNDFCVKELKDAGVPIKKIRREMFGTRPDIQKSEGWPENLDGTEVFKVHIGDKTIDAISGESLLTALERAGVRVNVCCRSGECSLCRVRLIDGDVFIADGVAKRKADEQYGYIHSCKSYPISDLTIQL